MSVLRVLIADDNIENLRLLMEDIKEIDLPVETISTPNGELALQKALYNVPDVILLDWIMPKMNGLETTMKLRSNEKTKLVPIIMVTSTMNTREDLQRAFDAGVTDFINRPYHKLELISRIKSALHLSNTYKQLIAEKRTSELALRRLKHINNELATVQEKLELELRAQKDTNRLLMETFEILKQLSKVNKE